MTSQRDPSGSTRRLRAAMLASRAAVLALASVLLLPLVASAHPLGNFTTNTYDGLTVSPSGVTLDHVLDLAEVPALQARQRIDTDRDGTVATTEAAAWARAECERRTDALEVRIDGSAVPLAATTAGIAFPTGQGGLVTLRLVCGYAGSVDPIAGVATVELSDRTDPDRLGWREIVVRGDAVTITGGEAFARSTSERLSAYPADAATRSQREARVTASPGGPAAPAPVQPDAAPIGSPDGSIVRDPATAAIPGGVNDLPDEITSLLQASDLGLPALLVSLLVAMAVGAVHAASPGHGKTLMAAYLVGTRGTARHAVALGLTVTVSHTIGVLALGAIVLAAGSIIPSERLFPILGVVSGLVVTALGVSLLAQRIRETRARERVHAASDAHHDHDGHGGDHAHEHGHDDGHGHDHPHTHEHQAHEEDEAVGGWHSHGPFRHTHLPQTSDPLRWRNLAALGLVGGLVPSASAILILVASISAGRPAYGMVLTVAFGLGMAVVLVGVGLLFVRARGLIERWPRADRLAPVLAQAPLITALVFLVVGAVITIQAGAGIA